MAQRSKKEQTPNTAHLWRAQKDISSLNYMHLESAHRTSSGITPHHMTMTTMMLHQGHPGARTIQDAKVKRDSQGEKGAI